MDAKQDKLLVSIIMPAYNAERFIEEAILSVQNQTWQQWELIVCDDGSNDGTCEIVKKYAEQDDRIVLIRNEMNIGVSKTRNKAMNCCKGEYIAFLDSDDIWNSDKLEKQIQLMKKTNASLCYCSYSIIDGNGEKIKQDYIVPKSVSYDYLLRENVVQCSAMIITSEIAQKFSFSSEYFHEDFVFCLDILKAGYTACGCVEVLHNYRYVENSRSFNKVKSAINRWTIYRKYIKLSLPKTIKVFWSYMTAGVKKYSH